MMKIQELPPALAEMYPAFEAKLLPMIKAKARRMRGLDPDDVIQESRVAVINAMASYDWGKGDFLPYARTIVDNTCRTLHSQSRTQSRCPRTAVLDADGTWRSLPTPPVSLDGMPAERADRCAPVASSITLPDARSDYAEGAKRVRAFKRKLLGRLDARCQEILKLKLHPSVALVEQIKKSRARPGDTCPAVDAPTNIELADHLGIAKNQLDWSLAKIRLAFADLVDDDEFSGMFASVVEAAGWPVVHVSRGQEQHVRFIDRILKQRKLDADARSVEQAECDKGSREVRWYGWGSIVTVWRGEDVWTAVVEGRLNPLDGVVYGTNGARRALPIAGYQTLAKALAQASKETHMDKKSKTARFIASLKVLPSCVSEYDPRDKTCAGNPKGKSDDDKAPCFHRTTCSALRIRMASRSAELADYVVGQKDDEGTEYYAPKDMATFAPMIVKERKTYKIKNGRPTHVPKGSPPIVALLGNGKTEPTTASEKKADKKGATVASNQTELDAIFHKWLTKISEETSKQVSEEPEAGDLYLKDRRETSRYAGLYVKAAKGRDYPVALCYYKTRNNLLDVKFALTPDGFTGIGADWMATLKPQLDKDGAFKAVSRGLNSTAVMASAEVIARLINSGILGAP